MQQQIKPTDDGIELMITDDSENTYTIGFHVPKNGKLDVYSNNDGTFSIVETDEKGRETVGKMEPTRGDSTTDALYGPTELSVVTDPATNITSTSAVLEGELQVLQNQDNTEITFEWGEVGNGMPNTESIGTIDRTGRFATKISGLTAGTDYEFKVSGDTADPLTFTTLTE